MDVVALVVARGGSKGVPGKNLARLKEGAPSLVAKTVQDAMAASLVSDVYISTDCQKIANEAASAGCQVPFVRPESLACDQAKAIDVIKHFLDYLMNRHSRSPDYVLLLQPTSPFRTTYDMERSIEIALEHRSPSVIGVKAMEDHPWLAYYLAEDGSMVPAETEERRYLRRQDMKTFYVVNGAIYLFKPELVHSGKGLVPQGAMPYIMPAERSLDIDTPVDLHLAKLLSQYPFRSEPYDS